MGEPALKIVKEKEEKCIEAPMVHMWVLHC